MDGGSGADAAGGDAVSAPDWLAARRCSAAQRVGSNYVWDIPSNARPIPVPGSGYCIAAAAVGQANAPEQFAAMLASVEEHPAYFNNFIPDAASLLPLARARPRTVYHDPELAPLAHMMPVALSASLKRRVLVGMPVHLECPPWIEVTPPFLTAEMRAADPVRILYNGVNHYYGYGTPAPPLSHVRSCSLILFLLLSMQVFSMMLVLIKYNTVFTITFRYCLNPSFISNHIHGVYLSTDITPSNSIYWSPCLVDRLGGRQCQSLGTTSSQ
jgi:hypothetical protein